MGRNKTTGLIKRGTYWYIDKQIFGRRIRESTGATSFAEAQAILARRIEDSRQAKIFGVRQKRTFKEAATKYLLEHQYKDSIDTDASKLRSVMPYVGNMFLNNIHMDSLQPFIQTRIKEGRKTRTINHGLKIISHILNLARDWRDENGLSWTDHAPKIKLLPENDARPPYPIDWAEEDRLMAALPDHLRRMALYAANTGSRDKEVYWLKWEWERQVPELNVNVFVIPSHITVDGRRVRLIKNGRDRLVILNKAARSVIEEVRGQHPEFVFTYKGHPVTRMNNKGWRNARAKAGLPDLHVHDLKHTFGRRLRAAGVSYEDRQDLLGHKSGRMTTHYSAAEIDKLLEAAEKACIRKTSSPTLTLIRTTPLDFPKTSPMKIVEEKKTAVI